MVIQWTNEDRDYWAKNYRTRPYFREGDPYELYEPAYRYGVTKHTGKAGQTWEDVESSLERSWENFEDSAETSWDRVKDAVKDGWHWVEKKLPGDADGDGR